MSDPARSRLMIFQGSLAFIAGAFLFSLSTVFIKFLAMPPYQLNPLMAAFSRFLIGFVVMAIWAKFRKIDLRPHNTSLVIWRGALNTIAIVLFYSAVQFTTITNTNLLNLMYPAWMLLAGPMVTGERSPRFHAFFLALTLLGAWLITNPGSFLPSRLAFNYGDALALASGVVAAFGIAVLRQARKFDGTSVVIFWLFAIGSAVTLIPTLLVWRTPSDLQAWLWLVLAGGCGFIGQVFITYGYRWVSAAQGSLLSSSGIVISAGLGTLLFADPLSAPLILGGLLILVSVIACSGIIGEMRRAHRRKNLPG